VKKHLDELSRIHGNSDGDILIRKHQGLRLTNLSHGHKLNVSVYGLLLKEASKTQR